MTRFMCALVALCLLAPGAIAQWDTDGPNAAFTINGQTPSVADPAGHIVSINVPNTLDLSVTSGANTGMGFLLVNGALTASAFGVPWGGSIDVGTQVAGGSAPPTNITIMIDTLFNSVASPFAAFATTPFSIGVSVGASFSGVNIGGFQTIVSDPSTPPFGFDNTEAGGPAFQGAVVTVYDAIGDDSSILHALNGVATPTGVTYGSTVYTQFYIGSNGMVTFATGSGDFSATTGEFFAGWQASPTASANPGIALGWQDMARGGIADDITIIENMAMNTVSIEYNNQEHWDSQLPAGSWLGTFDNNTPGLFTFDMSGHIFGDPTMDLGPLVGLSDGDDTVGTDYISDLDVDQAAAYTSMGQESIVEDFNATAVVGGAMDITVINFLDIAGYVYTLF